MLSLGPGLPFIRMHVSICDCGTGGCFLFEMADYDIPKVQVEQVDAQITETNFKLVVAAKYKCSSYLNTATDGFYNQAAS